MIHSLQPSPPIQDQESKSSITTKNDHWKPKSAHMRVFGSTIDFKPPSRVLGAIKVHPSKPPPKSVRDRDFRISGPSRNSFRTGTCVAQMSTQQCFLSLFFSIIAFSGLFNASKRLLAAQASTRGHGAPAWMPSWRNCVLTGKFFPVAV